MKMNKKGFTLIELLIVVAIIAILAAIAIPQFSKYRIRGYNAASDSDLRNIKIAAEAFFTDNQVYANTSTCPLTATNYATLCGGVSPGAALTNGPGTITAGPSTITINVTPLGITATQPSAPASMVFGLSNNVYATIFTNAATAGDYVIFTANASGDTIYAGESGVTTLFRSGKDINGAVVAVSSAAQVPGGALTAQPTGATENPVADLPASPTTFVSM